LLHLRNLLLRGGEREGRERREQEGGQGREGKGKEGKGRTGQFLVSVVTPMCIGLHYCLFVHLLQMLLKRLQQTRPSKELRRDVLAGSQSAGRNGSSRPLSAGRARVSSATAGQRPGGARSRPTSAVQRYPCTSRPATAFPSRPDDDDIVTWQPDDF